MLLKEKKKKIDVTIVLALNRIFAVIGIFFGNALCHLCFGYLSSVVRSFTKNYKMKFEICDLSQENVH